MTTEKIHLYLAAYGRGDRAEEGGGAEGEHENIRIIEMPLAELAAMADRAELTDLKTLTLVLALRASPSGAVPARENGRIAYFARGLLTAIGAGRGCVDRLPPALTVGRACTFQGWMA